MITICGDCDDSTDAVFKPFAGKSKQDTRKNKCPMDVGSDRFAGIAGIEKGRPLYSASYKSYNT